MTSTTPIIHHDENEMRQEALKGLNHLPEDKKHAVMAAELISEKRGIVGITGSGAIDVNKLTREVGNKVSQLMSHIHAQRPDLLSDTTKAASEISRVDNELEAIKSSVKGTHTDLPTLQSAESSLRGLELRECLIIGIDKDLIKKVHDLFKNINTKIKNHGKTKNPKKPPTPPPAPTHTPPTNPNILGTHNISITSLPHSEKIQGGINAGEILWMTKDGVHWSSVPVDTSNNFSVPILETANGSYTYRFKTKNVAGVESGEETVTVDINIVAPAAVPKKPTITSGTNFSVDAPTIEGTTTPDSEVQIYEGTNKIGDGVADSSGHFSIKTSSLADGAHNLKIEAKNPSDLSKKSHTTQNINIQKPLSLNPVSIDTSSGDIERGTANPQIVLKDAVVGSQIRITDTTGKVLCDVMVNKLDASGNFKVTLRGLDTRKVGPEDITIQAIDPNNLGNAESNDQTINIIEQKIKFTHPPKAALTKPGKQENGRSFSINLDDIIPGSKVQIKNPRIPGGVEEIYANAKTFAQSLYNIDTTKPSTGPEELLIQMIDPNDTTGTTIIPRLGGEALNVIKIIRANEKKLTGTEGFKSKKGNVFSINFDK